MYLLEEILSLHSHHAPHHDHSHEDPHAHSHHVALIACVALVIHTLFDGMAIRAAREVSDMLSYGVLFGVVIHQIPMSLSLAAILKKSQVSRQMQIICMLIFSVSIAFGYMLAHLSLQHLGQSFAIYATALAGGSLLYIATVDLLPMTHAESKRKFPIITAFCLGIALMVALSLWGEDIHSHHMNDGLHEHAGHHESADVHHDDIESHHDDHDHDH